MDILSRIMAIASLFFVLTIGMQVYPMDSAAQYRVMHNESAQKFSVYVDVKRKSGGFKNKKIGYLSYVLQDDGTAFISLLIVNPEYQGRGVGGTLLDTAIDYFRAQSRWLVSLEAHPVVAEGTTPDQVVCAQERLYAFYGKRGFEFTEEGRRDMVLQLCTPACDESESMSVDSPAIWLSSLSDSQE